MTRTKRAVLNVGVVVGGLVGALGWAGRSGVVAVDTRFVHVDSFRVYQSGVAKSKAVDSVNYVRDMQDVRAKLARIDTNVICLKPRNRNRQECQ